MHLARVPVGEGLATAATLQRLVRGVQLLHVYPQVGLAAALGGAELASVHRLLGDCGSNTYSILTAYIMYNLTVGRLELVKYLGETCLYNINRISCIDDIKDYLNKYFLLYTQIHQQDTPFHYVTSNLNLPMQCRQKST